MPSRRQLLAAAGSSIAGAAGAAYAIERRVPPASAAVEWPTARYDAAGTGWNPAASAPRDDPQVRWATEPESSVRGPAPPILVGDAVVLTGNQSIVALDRETGDVRFERPGHSFLSGPTRAAASAYRSDALVVESRSGLYGLDAAGGYGAVGASFGLERWHAPGPEPTLRTSATPTVSQSVAAAGTVYGIVPDTNRVVALDANSGRARWTYAVGDETSSHPNRPAVRDGSVFVTSWPDQVVALYADRGQPHWRGTIEPREPDSPADYREVGAPTATDEGLVVPSRRAVTLLDPDDGAPLWEYVHGGAGRDASVAVADGTVLVADGEEALHGIDLATGERQWTVQYRHDASPVVADGVAYLGYFWGTDVVAVDVVTGERLWTHEVGHGVSQPIVGDGVLYVVADDRVVALEAGGAP